MPAVWEPGGVEVRSVIRTLKVSNEATNMAPAPVPAMRGASQFDRRTHHRSWAKDRVMPMVVGAVAAGILIFSGVAFIDLDVPATAVGVSY